MSKNLQRMTVKSSAKAVVDCVDDTKVLAELRLIGGRIVGIRDMTSDELESEGWECDGGMAPKALILNNGVKLFASCDAEGNGPGMLFGRTSDGLALRFV